MCATNKRLVQLFSSFASTVRGSGFKHPGKVSGEITHLHLSLGLKQPICPKLLCTKKCMLTQQYSLLAQIHF